MTFVGVLWLVLLQAFALAEPSRPVGVAERALRAAPTRAEHAAAVRASEPATVALLAARTIDAGTLPRASRSAPLRDGTTLPLHRFSRLAVVAVDGQASRRTHRYAGHAVASRGGLLAYFPTAPPLQD